MPTLSFTAQGGVQTIGPLDEGTDFMVIDGSCSFSTAAFAADNIGFPQARGDRFFVAEGKTLRLQTSKRCTLHYEALA